MIVFPIVSAIGVLVVMASFALPMTFAGFFDALSKGRSQVFGFMIGFVFYVVQYAVIIFANSALVGAAMIRLQGGAPDASALVLDLTQARERAGERAALSLRLRPGPPHSPLFEAFAEKVAVAGDLALESLVLSNLGELTHAHLKWRPRAIEG